MTTSPPYWVIEHLSYSRCKNDKNFLMAEVYNHRIMCYFEDPFEPLYPIRDDDHLSTYKLCQGESPLLEFRHLNWKEDYFSALGPGYWKPFGMSLILRLQDGANPEVDLQSSFQTRLAQLL